MIGMAFHMWPWKATLVLDAKRCIPLDSVPNFWQLSWKKFRALWVKRKTFNRFQHFYCKIYKLVNLCHLFGWNGNRNMMFRFTRGSIFNSIKDRCMVFNLKATTIYHLFPCFKNENVCQMGQKLAQSLKTTNLGLGMLQWVMDRLYSFHLEGKPRTFFTPFSFYVIVGCLTLIRGDTLQTKP